MSQLLYQVFISVLLVSICMWVLFIEQKGDIIVRLAHSVHNLHYGLFYTIFVK
jgi:hypothetical protein